MSGEFCVYDINYYDEFAIAASDIGKRTDIDNLQKVSELKIIGTLEL